MNHPLSKFAHLARDPDPNGPNKAAKEFWHRHGGVAFTADQLRQMEGLTRQLIEAVAANLYGKRK